ncbi:MAG TPA: hypothetical protein VF158_02735 [Longimicrobiales bacterium]
MKRAALAFALLVPAALVPGWRTVRASLPAAPRAAGAAAAAQAPAATRPTGVPVTPDVAVAVAPDTVRVGDIFRAAVRVDLPPGYRAEFPDSLVLGDAVEQAGRRGGRDETLPDGTRRITVVYPLSAWRPGAVALPAVPVRLTGPDGERTVEARLPGLTVRSILPADTTGLHPRGPKDVLGASRTRWPLLVALLVGAVAVGGMLYWRRRGRDLPLPVAPPIPPRERALSALDRARASGLLEAGRFKPFYSLVTAAVRLYLEALNADWGTELTTTELIERAGRGMRPEDVAALERLLGSADLVKFARRRPTPEEALSDWEAARAWVLAFDAPAAPGASGASGAGAGAPGEVVA